MTVYYLRTPQPHLLQRHLLRNPANQSKSSNQVSVLACTLIVRQMHVFGTLYHFD